MENLISPENLEDIREMIESKISDIPGAVGALLLSSYFNKTGHKQAGSINY